MKEILLTILLLIFGSVAVASADTFVAPVFDANTYTATFEGHTYSRHNTAEIQDMNGLPLPIFIAIYKSEDNGDLMAVSKCEDCLPFSWLVVHDKSNVYSDVNYQIFDEDCDGTFDSKFVGREVSVPRPVPKCLHKNGGIYGIKRAI
jgi:hypothetical protein